MNILTQSKWKKIPIIATFTSVIIGASLVYYNIRPLNGIYDFNEKRDTTVFINLFRREWDWLVLSPDYSPEFMLKFKTPSQNPLDIGKLNIKVLYINNSFAGFVTYHKEKDSIGRLLFLAVHPDFRGKGYAEKLVNYVLHDFKRMNFKTVKLVTLLTNTRAQKVYNKIGFIKTGTIETHRGDIQVKFKYDLRKL